jgi:hypothetical protein
VARTFVIGDVHGCADELEDLLARAGPAAEDRIVLVGDLVAKGPQSRRVLALVRALGAQAVRGNHDEHVLRFHRAREAGEPEPALKPGHLLLARELDADDWALLAGLPLWLRLPEHEALVVHAGLVPGVPLERQDPALLMNIRTLRPDGSGSSRKHDGVLWGERWEGPERVLFGHHAERGLQEHPHAIGLDTGCVYGKRLTGCWLPSRELVSVPARHAYAPIEAER